MGGRGSASGIGASRAITSLGAAPTTNYLAGKTGTDKQKAYAEKLVTMTKNTINKKISDRRKDQKFFSEKIKEAKNTSNEKISAIKLKAAKDGLKKAISDSNKSLKFYTNNLKKVKKQKTYGQVITVLGG